MPKKVYRVGLDCRLAGRRHAGIGRYVENLIRELLQLPNQCEWVLFFSDPEQAEQVLGKWKETPHLKLVFSSVRHYSLSEQLHLPGLFSRENLDLLHVPHFNVPLLYQGRLVVTIHDLLWHEYRGTDVTTLPLWQYWPKYLMYRLTVNTAVAHAAKLIVPSQTVADQVRHYYPETKDKLKVIAEGVDERFFQSHPGTSPHPYLVYLGSLYPHKNVRVIIDALKQLPDYTLKIISARSAFQDKLRDYVRENNLEERVEFLGYQDDADVAHTLHQATALVQPSLSEGFGLTGLEAMAAGTPVVASDIPVFREVYGDQAVFFAPQEVPSFVAAVKRVENLDRAKYGKAAVQFARQYQWSTMAQQTLAVYQEALTEL